jgi:hypothetical protein
MSAIHELNTVSVCKQDERAEPNVSTSLNNIASTCFDSTAGRSPHGSIEHVATSTAELSEQPYSGLNDRNTDSPHDRPYKLIENVRDYNEAVYDEPNDSDNDSTDTGYLEIIEKDSDFAKAVHLTPVGTPVDANGAYCEPADCDSTSARTSYLELIDGDDNSVYSDLFTLAETDYSEPFDLAEADYTELTDLAEPGYFQFFDCDNNLAHQAAQYHIIHADEHYEDLDVAADDDSANPAYGGQAQVFGENAGNTAHNNIGD